MDRLFPSAAILLLLTCTLAHAQGLGAQAYGQPRGFDPNAPKRDVSGSVLNSVSGEPIPNALVQMMGLSQRAAFTDSEGNFRFEAVPEGAATFMARKPGFFSSEELTRGGFRPRSPMKIDASTGSIVLKLVPEAIVTGVITAEDGEPLERVRIRLKRQIVSEGRKQWEERPWGQTNEDGEFRIANLAPGAYYVVAEGVRPAGPRAAAEPATGYPPTYYPGAPDVSSATALELRAGQTAQADFRLRAQPLYEVGGVVSGIPEGGRGVNVQFSTRAGDPVGANLHFDPDDGSFTAKLPAGTYTVRAFIYEQPRRVLTASTTVTVAGNVNRLSLVLQPAPSIPIVVRTEFTKPPQSSPNAAGGMTGAAKNFSPARYASVALSALDSNRPGGVSSMLGDSDNPVFAVQNVEPGRYAVQIRPGGPWYVQSATCGQTDLLREDLVVGSGAEARPIEIVLRDDGGSVTGSVMSDNAAVPAVLLVVPERHSTPPQQQYASPNGFALSMLAPGDYLLFAFDSTDGLEYTNRDALDPYLSRAARVSVSANGSFKVTLELIKRGEP